MQVNCFTYILLTLASYQLQIKKIWYPNSLNNFFVKKGKAQKVQIPKQQKGWYQNMAKKFFVT